MKKVLKRELASNRKYKTTYKDIKKYFNVLNKALFKNILQPFNDIQIKKTHKTKSQKKSTKVKESKSKKSNSSLSSVSSDSTKVNKKPKSKKSNSSNSSTK